MMEKVSRMRRLIINVEVLYVGGDERRAAQGGAARRLLRAEFEPGDKDGRGGASTTVRSV
jgi:hypothetical protein